MIKIIRGPPALPASQHYRSSTEQIIRGGEVKRHQRLLASLSAVLLALGLASVIMVASPGTAQAEYVCQGAANAIAHNDTGWFDIDSGDQFLSNGEPVSFSIQENYCVGILINGAVSMDYNDKQNERHNRTFTLPSYRGGTMTLTARSRSAVVRVVQKAML
jgi:hypothetical protein